MTKLFGKNIARSTDLLFLKTLVGSNSCIRHEKAILEEDLPPEMPVTHDSMRLIDQAKAICEQRIYLDEAKELYSLISSKWMRNVLEIHDQLAAQIANSREEVEYIDGVSSVEEEDDEDARTVTSVIEASVGKKEGKAGGKDDDEEVQVDTFRVIGIRRQPGECLGLTVRMEEGRVTVARILIDSVIDRQGLVRPGDVILQANGKPVKSAEQLQEVIEDSDPDDDPFIVLKIQPSAEIDYTADQNFIAKTKNGKIAKQFFIRALFDYNPENDNLLPCQDIGLPFSHGDIMEVLSWSDPSWWQARKINSKERPGLIPSQDLEERRQCFVYHNGFNSQVTCCGDYGSLKRMLNKKDKKHYTVRKNMDFDKLAECSLYELLEKMPPFSRKTLVLVSPPSIDLQPLIDRLTDHKPDMFGTATQETDRPIYPGEKDGLHFNFILREKMDELLRRDDLLDFRQHNSYRYGTTFAAIRKVMAHNKLCIVNCCNPESLKILHNSTEFLPFVIFVGQPLPASAMMTSSMLHGGGGSEEGDVDTTFDRDDLSTVGSEVQTPFPQRRRSHVVGGGESDTNSERTVVVVQVPAESNGGGGGVLIKSNGHTSVYTNGIDHADPSNMDKASSTETLKHPEVTIAAAATVTTTEPVELTYEQEESEAVRREFQKYFDLEVVYTDIDTAFATVRDSLVKLTNETQWVPRNWVYS